ncbi:hypothetical protein DXG01_011803 [Tephrocybe rancida]|nr:hypothetical protein DXG01_011803 [Tephrocybe rancida]
MVTIRHGESEDNTKLIWAGWKDAPLSALGRRQASALASFLKRSNTHFTHIYASPLLRAHATGLAALSSQSHNPPFTINPKLREQHFGAAEGKFWAYNVPRGETIASMIEKDIYPVLPTRQGRFEGGESLDDLAARADEAMAECVLPHVVLGEKGEVHVALASHGLCISECVKALLRLDPEADLEENYTGLLNTAWTRLTVEPREGSKGLRVIVTDVNRSEHLEGVDTISEPVADNDARAFFGGKSIPDSPAAHI